MEKECPVAFAGGRYTPVKPVELIQRSLHLKLFLSLPGGFSAGIETGCPLVFGERHIRNDGIEQQQISVRIQEYRISKSITPANLCIADFVDIHVHLRHCYRRAIDFLTIDGYFFAVLLFRSLNQQRAGSTSWVVNTLTGLHIHDASHDFGNRSRGIERSRFLAGHACKLTNHVFISIADDICGHLTFFNFNHRWTKI